ncbi:MAG: nucleotide exchange factor GrpE [Muribaculaceae bacterium]|nr:nucleotide exchange factor GrpE [Muribaculaceae bacterium]
MNSNRENFNNRPENQGYYDENVNPAAEGDLHLEDPDVEAVDVEPDDDDVTDTDSEVSELENLRSLLQAKEDEVAKEKKEYMFLMAEFDNFRKRTIRERADLIKTASEKALQGLLPIVDDFERGLDAIKESTDAEAVKEGMNLIYNKFVKYLNDNGVKVMQSTGSDFDPDLHEAIAMVSADQETPAGKVKDTVQKGYTLNDKVLRHAKVVVAQ